jgi:YesN/AraC family two-component response regulator
VYAEVLFFWSFGQVTAFVWFNITPFAAMIFFKRKTVITWNIGIFLLICSVFIVTPFIPEGYFERPEDKQLMIINIMTIVLNTALVIFFVYYLGKINILKESYQKTLMSDVDGMNIEITDNKDIREAETNKFERLYSDILTYFSEKKPYCNPDFTIAQLAKELDTNVKYIAKAIKIKENVNFIGFLNKYRVNLVKELITKDFHNKYTIRHIYTLVGFKYQSTFNKVFKEIEGLTPSEYIKTITKTNDGQ